MVRQRMEGSPSKVGFLIFALTLRFANLWFSFFSGDPVYEPITIDRSA
jgi:hypothetical protein